MSGEGRLLNKQGEESDLILNDIQSAIETSPRDSAKSMHDHVEQELLSLGYAVVREYGVPNRGDGRGGFIDLLVTNGEETAVVELDNTHARKKSIFKMNSTNADYRVIGLRNPKARFPKRTGIFYYQAIQ